MLSPIALVQTKKTSLTKRSRRSKEIEMTIDEWIAEFKRLSPVDTDGMDFTPAAKIAVACGISPLAVLKHIASMSRDEIDSQANKE